MRFHLIYRSLKAAKALLLCGTALIPVSALLGLQSAAFGQAVNLGKQDGNAIVPDGRTLTRLRVQGSTTTISTSTLAGGNAYNSFSTFTEAAGNTVNLIVPRKAGELVNIVRNGPVDIQGTLNSYKNGKVGGNVVFADSYGFIVGPSGVVNVGGLTVTTPTGDVIDKIIDKSGTVDQALAARVISGNVPLSSDGSVLIRGQINAQNFVRITAQDVEVAGSVAEAERAALHRAQFEATVNTSGMVDGGAIVVHNGTISIVAANNATISGKLSASGLEHTTAAPARAQANTKSRPAVETASATPSITVTAGKIATILGDVSVHAAVGAPGSISITATDIAIGATARLAAQGEGTLDGGRITVKAADTTTVTAGASFVASALGTGNGGLVELSGETDRIDPNIHVDLGSVVGSAGTLLFDPDNLIVGTTSHGSQGDDAIVGGTNSTTASLYTHGANVELDAATSITINGVIDTRAYAGDITGSPVAGQLSSAHPSTGNSGSITLNAPSITVASGGALYADAYGSGFTAGSVTLTATASDSQVWTPSSATTGITVAGTITGGAISATATSTASTSFTSAAQNLAQLPVGVLGSAFTGLNGGYVASSATATITVSGTIQGSGAVTLSSIGSETASDPIISVGSLVFGSSQPLAAAVVVGNITGNVSTKIQSGATISAGGTLSVTSTNAATLSISAQTMTFTGQTVDATVAYSHGSVTTSAEIDSGATISSAASLNVAAQNTNSFSTTSSANALGTAKAGVAVAINDVSTTSTAQLGASVPLSAGVGNITVYSGSNTTANVVQASTTVGDTFITAGLTTLVSTVTAPITMFFGGTGAVSGTGAGSAMAGQGTSTIVPRAGVSLALNLDSQSSTAAISATNGGTDPTIVASGQTAVVSLLTDADIRADASTTINSNTYIPSPSSPSTSSALSLAVNVAQIGHTSNAYIGSKVNLTSGKIGVDAQTLVPITNHWTDFSTFSNITQEITDLAAHANGNLGIVNTILTSYANATSESSTTGLAGAVNYFNITNHTTAWIASGAHLTEGTTGATGIGAWSSSIAFPTGGSTTINWASGLAVTASTTTESINVGGNFSWLTLFGTSSTSTTGTAVGGSANVNIFSTDTVAGIGAGALISALEGVNVAAHTTDLVYGVAPTSGKGSGLGLNGIASVLEIENTTSASISDLAQVTASNVSINAQQDLSSLSIAGAVGASKGAGFGLAVAYLKIDTDTSAYVGDNSTALAASGATADDRNVSSTVTAYVNTPALSVSALTVGRLTTVSVAAQFNNNTPSDPNATQAEIQTAPDSDSFGDAVKFFFTNAGAGATAQFASLKDAITGSNLTPVEGTNSIAGAGSTSADLTALGTSAYISHATIDKSPYALGGSVSVQALNNTIIDTASGAAAIAKGAPGTQYNVGVAGAVALDLSTNSTTAKITNSSVNADNVTVQALSGGENTAVGLALSATFGQSGTSVAVSASVSAVVINDGVNALVDSSTITAPSASVNNVFSISADQDTFIGIGAGSLYVKLGEGNGGGVGVALTYAQIGNPSGGNAVSAILSNSSVADMGSLSLLALDQSRIISGAAVGGGGPDASGFAGSVVVNNISPTVLAEITNAPAVSGTAVVTGGITVSSDVTVVSSGGSNTRLDQIISTEALIANGGLTGGGVPVDDSGIDFTGQNLSPNTSTGAAIVAVAGLVQVATGSNGASNVGAALVIDTISQTHQAVIDGVTLTSTGGVVKVAASDDAEIISVALGVGVASGTVGGVGSVVYNSITNAVIAEIGHETTTHTVADTAHAQVEAAAISVTAEDGSTIRGAAGAVSVNIGGGNAIGLSVTVDQISNYVNASIVGASVTADETLTNGSNLIVGQLQVGNVLVSGQSNATITSVAIGTAITAGTEQDQQSPAANMAALLASLTPASGSGEAASDTPPTPAEPATGLAGAGSLVISTEATSVSSSIDYGANSFGSTVNAANNVIVAAKNIDTIGAYAGALSVSANAGLGIGASVIVNEISGTTSAYANRSTVDAHATGAAVSVDNGLLASTIDPSNAVTPATSPSLGDGTNSLHGMAFTANSSQTVQTVAAVYSASTDDTALSANVITDKMGGTTQAYATYAQLDTNLLTGQASAVQITAASASFANNLDIGMADSGSNGAGTVVLVLNTMNRTTDALAQGTAIGSSTIAAGAVNIAANAWEGTSGEAIGASASDGYGVAGSALVNLFSATTSASFFGNTSYIGSLSTNANTTDGYFAAVGNAAIGSEAGVGAGVIVATINNTTSALVGDASTIPSSAVATTLNMSGALTVAATTTTKTNSYDIAFSAGGTAGVAAMVSFNAITNRTFSALDNTHVTIPTASGTVGAINVTSQENATIDPVAGGLAAGGTGGIGASANIVILKSTNSAQMLNDTVSTPGAVNVTANSTRNIKAVDVTGGLGGTAGIAATVGVVLVGSAASSDMLGLINAGNAGSLGSADAASQSNGGVVAAVGAGIDGISATITGGSVSAASVQVNASANTEIQNIVGSLALGASAGFGAAVGFTNLNQTVTASATGGSITASSLTIMATADGIKPSDPNASTPAAAWTLAVAGAGGAYVGLGAAVAYADAKDNVSAKLGSTANGVASGTLKVSASDSSALEGDAYGAAIGVGAVGISIGEANKSSTVAASFLASTTVTNFNSVSVKAASQGEVGTYTVAGAAGVAGGAGTSATSTDSETVTASIGASSNITVGSTGLLVSAVALPELSSSAIGVGAGAAVGIGIAIAKSNASEAVTAYVDDNSTISGGSLTITAAALTSSSFDTAKASAVAAGGGLLTGLNGSDAEASDTATVIAYGGNNLHLPSANVTIAAESDSKQNSDTTGISFAYVGLGANVASATSNTTTSAYLDPGSVTATSNLGILTITASGTDSNTAKALSGSGGVVAGAAATAITSTTDTTSATLLGNGTTDTLYFGGIAVNALHTTTFSADGDAFQASAVGASGGVSTNTVSSTVTAEIGTHLIINSAGGDMIVVAKDTVNEITGGARAGSGGVVAGAATVSNSTVTQTVTTNIDANTVLSLNDDPSTSTAKIDIEAYNFVTTTDTVSLIAGGLFAGGGAESDLSVTAHNNVNIGNTVTLFSAGELDIGTATEMTSSNNANASLYGLVSGAGASTSSSLTAYQTVAVGSATIEAWGLLNIYAGQSGSGLYDSYVSANATTTVYNEAVVPISARYRGQATAHDYTSLTLGAGSQVLGVNNIFIGSVAGSVQSAGLGTNYNPYLSIFSTENHDNESNNPATDATGALALNGTIAAGIHNQEIITIAYNGTISLSSGGSLYGLALEEVNDVSLLNPVMSYNHQKLQYAMIAGFNPRTQIIDQLATLSGLSTSAVSAALLAQTQITAAVNDAAGDNQRQINTLVVQAAFATNASGPSIAFGDILVSEGSVTVKANTLTAAITNGVTPSISGAGSAKIDIENLGTDFLDLSKLTVTGVTNGHVDFTGTATSSSVIASSTQGLNVSQDVSTTTPSITVNASYAGRININTGQVQVVDSNNNVLATTPDIYFDANVVNLNGVINVNNQLGSVVIASQEFSGATVQMTVPNGNFTYNGGAGTIYTTGSAVASAWATNEYRPTDVTTAVDAAATYIERTFLDGYYDENNNWISAPISNYASGDQSKIFTARMLAQSYHPGSNGSVTSAIFLPTGSNANGENAPWFRGNYQNQAYGPDSGPFNYATHDANTGYFTVVNIQPLSKTASTAGSPTTSGISGRAVIISASVLNINGNITSGQSSSFSVDIGTAAATQIATIKNDANKLADYGTLVALTTTTVNGGDTKVGASYDVLNDQIIVNSVVQGAGGYVYLNGRIISTSTTVDGQNSPVSQGNIIVNGGYGPINIKNETDTKVVTNTINTGVSSKSVVEIVDQNKNQTTWYVYDAAATASQAVTTYTEAGVNNTSYGGASINSIGANSGLQYTPLANQLFQWTDTTTLSRTPTTNSEANGWTFTGVSSNSTTYPYAETTALVTGSQSSNYLETVTATGSYQQNPLATGNAINGTDFSNGTWYQNIYNSLNLTLVNTVKASNPININFSSGSNSNVTVTSNASIVVNGPITNHNGSTTVTASGATSAITAGTSALVSGQTVTLSGDGGIGSLAAPLPVAVYGGTLSADSINHDIALAASGGLTINHVTVSAGSSSTPQGNVLITATGDINSAATYNPSSPVVTGKSIEIDTTGGAIGAVSGVLNGASVLTNINPLVIEAKSTTLGNGSIDGGVLTSSSSTGAYIIQSTGDLRLGTITSNGAVLLDAAATDGHTANIINGLTTGGLTTAQTTYLQSVWTSLELQSGAGALAVSSYQSMINAAYRDYWQLVTVAFQDGHTYSISAQGLASMKAQIAAQTGTAVSGISTDQVQAYATTKFLQDEYLLGIVTAGQLGQSLDTLFGTAAGQTSQFQQAAQTTALTTALNTYSASFSYQLPTTSALYTSLTSGSQWTLDQLTYSVDRSADPASNTPPPSITSLPLNIAARQVMLYAPEGSIGSLAPSQSFTFTSVNASSLSDSDKALLVSAGPGQLQVTTTALANGVTQYDVTLTEQSLIIVSPLGTVSASAQSQIYLGSATDLKLGGISSATYGPVTAAYSAGVQTTAGGNVKLEAVGSILGGVSGQVAISGNIANLTLIAETGHIGSAGASGSDPASDADALLLALTSSNTSPIGEIDQARAAQGIYLRQTSGDLVLGNVVAGSGTTGVIQLGATGSIYADAGFTDRTAIHIIGSSLDLRAGGSVNYNGSTYQPLQVEVTGAVTGSAVGNLSLLSVAGNLTAGVAGQSYGTLTSGGTLALDAAAGNLTINTAISGTSGLNLLANGSATIAAGTSSIPLVLASSNGAVTVSASSLSMGAYSSIDAAGVITVTTTGDATLGQLDTTLANSSTPAIIVSTGGVSALGAILSNGDGRENIVASGTGASVVLTASGDIGSSTTALAVDEALLSLTSSQGNVFASSINALHLSSATVTVGSLALSGNTTLTLDLATAGTTLDVTSSNSSVTIGSATAGGTETINARTALGYTALKTNGISGDVGDIKLTSSTGAITGTTATDTLDAHGNFSLNAATTVSATSVKADTGSGSVIAGSDVTIGTTTAATTLGVSSSTGFANLGTVTAGTALTVTASSGPVTIGTVTAGTTADVTASNSSVTIGLATAGGTETINARTALGYTTLKTTGISGDVGDIKLTSSTGAITGTTATDTLDAHGSFILNAATTVSATSVKADTGSGSVIAGSDVTIGTTTAATTLGVSSSTGFANLGTVTAGTALTVTASSGPVTIGTVTAGTTADVTASNSSVTIGSATAGGTETINARTALGYTTLKTNGISGDVGDIKLTSSTGAITGTTATDTLDAHGSFVLNAATTVSATSIKADTGSGSVIAGSDVTIGTTTAATTLGVSSTTGLADIGTLTAGTALTVTASSGPITLGTVTAGTTADITASNSSVTIGSATAGGTETINARTALGYTTLKTNGISGDVGDIKLTSSTGAITGTTATDTLDAHGNFSLNAATTVSATSVKADTGSGSVIAGSDVTIGTTTAATTLGVSSSTGLADIGTLTAGTALTVTASSGPVTIGTVTAGTTADVTASNSSVTIGSATAGGTETINAKTALGYTTLKTNGISGDVGDIKLTSSTGAITGTTATDTLDAHGSFVLNAATTVSATSIKADTGSGSVIAGSDVTIGTTTAATTLGVSSTTGLADIGTLTAGTALTVTASSGPITLGTVTAGTTADITASNSSVTIGSATAGGTETINARTALGYTTLKTNGISGDVGDIKLTSSTGAITGTTATDTLDAHGNFSLNAATTVSATSVKADTGSGSVIAGSDVTIGTTTAATTLGVSSSTGLADIGTLTAGTALTVTASSGPVTIGTVTAGTTADVTASNSSVTIGSATAGGTETINAHDGLTLATLKSTGGDIVATSQTGSITGGDVDAFGSALLSAQVNNTGHALTARNGRVALTAGGLIDWGLTTAHGAVAMTSATSTITVGDVTSGGTQTYVSPGTFTFGHLVTTGLPSDVGDIAMTSTNGEITGQSIIENGGLSVAAQGEISIADLKALGSIALSSKVGLNEGNLSVGSGTSFAAPNITIANLSASAGNDSTFRFSVTGYQGATGSNANITVNTQAPVVLTTLAEQNAVINETSSRFQIADGTIQQTLTWNTPTSTVWMNNESVTPIIGPDLQLYAPSRNFTALQFGTLFATNSYVVGYGTRAGVTVDLPQGPMLGASFIRDFDRTGGAAGATSTPVSGSTGFAAVAFTGFSPTYAFVSAPSTNVLIKLDPSLDGSHIFIDDQGRLILDDKTNQN